MLKKTPLHGCHQAQNATFINFAGWEMPLHYGSQLEEHHQVRNGAGIFDVSHMLCIDIVGEKALPFLRHLLANDPKKLSQAGRALYSCLLNDRGGVLDDLILYRLLDNHYRCVVNAATREKDLSWFNAQASSFHVKIIPQTNLAILAIQGPQALDQLEGVFPSSEMELIRSLKPFQAHSFQEMWIARTGYTGEDGIEVLLPGDQAVSFWNSCLKNKIAPIGLGARDTLRLEAGLNLYGTDMDETVTPLESHLAWTVDLKDQDRNFIGKEAILKQMEQGAPQQLVGLVLLEKGVCRPGMPVFIEESPVQPLKGCVTSGTFSPTLSCGIAFARIPTGHFTFVEVLIRNKKIKAKVIQPPFVKHGIANFKL